MNSLYTSNLFLGKKKKDECIPNKYQGQSRSQVERTPYKEEPSNHLNITSKTIVMKNISRAGSGPRSRMVHNNKQNN